MTSEPKQDTKKLKNCHELDMPTFHKFRLKFIKDKATYVCQVCGHKQPMLPSQPLIVSKSMYELIKDFKP